MSDAASRIEFCPLDMDRHRELVLQVRAERAKHRPPEEDSAQADLGLYEAHWKEALRDPLRRVWVGELDGRPVSLIEVSFRPRFDPPEGHISDLFVLPEWRRRGIARRMVGMAEQWLREQGAAVVSLEVSASNEPARRLVRGLSYKPWRIVLRKPLR